MPNTSTVHIPGLGQVQILNMAPQFAMNGVQGLPAGAQILSAGTQFQTSAGQFATAAMAQPTMQQALQQDPQDPTKWHVVQVATAPAISAAPATLQAMQDTMAGNAIPATHTAQLVTTISGASNNERNRKFTIQFYLFVRLIH